MARKKNKIEILDRIITEAGLSSEFDWDHDYDYNPRYCDYYCDCHLCVPEYEYLPIEESVEIYIHRRNKYLRYQQSPIQIGKMIDMKSIKYSKDILRQKRINYILGIEEVDTKLTLGDFWNIKN